MINLLLLISLAAAPQHGPAPVKLYNQGNAAYSSGDYPGAIAAYRQALESADHPHLRYNLSNAYFKNGQIGLAVIQLRRARDLAPRDPDIAHNLEFLRSFRVDKTASQAGPLEQALDRIFTYFSSREAAFMAGLCFLLGAGFLSLFIVAGPRWALFPAATAILGFAYFLAVTQLWQAERRAKPAAIIAKETSALSGPGDDFKEILLLHDGTEVKIKEKRGDYLLVQLPGGLGGWVPQGAVESVYR
jgi:tetratricopeptide (TPR) repeat protein